MAQPLAQASAQARYPHDIPSLPTLFPFLENIPNIPECNRAVAKNAPLDKRHINDPAMAIATSTPLAFQGNPHVTFDVVESARQRHAVLTNIHGTAAYGAGDITTTLADIQARLTPLDNLDRRFEDIDDRFKKLDDSIKDRFKELEDRINDRFKEIDHRLAKNEAKSENTCRRAMNAKGLSNRTLDGLVYRMVKERPGLGHELCRELHPNDGHHYHLHAINDEPPISSEASYLPSRIGEMTHQEILNLVSFYNDDFGITADDTIEVRRGKVQIWHIMYII
ncbi:hypothetical protein GYMLUDRAFT_83097 [Collybiopsis luxurians FD-317 M1]|nr:hypothetical protein GYMLUDRAFT_83097 [Collybiopsis luxurians FD-317 M1]